MNLAEEIVRDGLSIDLKPFQVNPRSLYFFTRSIVERRLKDRWTSQMYQNLMFKTFCLMSGCATSRNWRESDFTYDALETWIESCSTSDNWLNVHRLDAYNSRLNGMSISSTNKRVITGYRGRCRTLWTDEERLNNDEYFTFRHAQQAEDLERSGIGVIEYNLEHSDLGTDANKRMKKQELDISRLQTALKSLFPSLDGPNR